MLFIELFCVQGKRQAKVHSRKDSVKVRVKSKEGGSNASNTSVRDSRLSRDSGLDEQTSPQPLVQSERKHLLSSSMTNYSSVGSVGRRGVCVYACVRACVRACVCVCVLCLHTCVHACMRVCTRIHLFIYAYSHRST